MSADCGDEVSEEFVLLRRVPPDWVIDDENLGRPRPTSQAFRDPEMSVDVVEMLACCGLDHAFTLRQHPDFWVAQINVAECHAQKLKVAHKPEPDNFAHAEVIGKKTDATTRALSRSATWIVRGVRRS